MLACRSRRLIGRYKALCADRALPRGSRQYYAKQIVVQHKRIKALCNMAGWGQGVYNHIMGHTRRSAGNRRK